MEERLSKLRDASVNVEIREEKEGCESKVKEEEQK
jgi:hypothetical protein